MLDNYKCRIFLFFILVNVFNAQTTEKTGWIVNDSELTKKFLGTYLDTLENYEDLMTDRDPQSDDQLVVRIDIGRDSK